MGKQKNDSNSGECNGFKFVANRKCEYFPCHRNADPDKFNCLFCYCPLYALGSSCGGNFKYLENGVKDCSECLLPHSEGSHEHIMKKANELIELAKKNR